MRSNTKIVREKVRNHIFSFCENNGNEEACLDELRDNREAARHHDMTDYQAGVELVKGGSFLVYHYEVKEFLNSLDINPQGKEYSDEKSWNLYCHLVSSELEKMLKEDK